MFGPPGGGKGGWKKPKRKPKGKKPKGKKPKGKKPKLKKSMFVRSHGWFDRDIFATLRLDPLQVLNCRHES